MSKLWNASKSLGDIGEAMVKKWLIENGFNVEDVSNQPEYWEQDIDLIVDGKAVEIKTDKKINKTKNMFLETDIFYKADYTSKKGNKHEPGWFNYTKAEYLIYVDYNMKKMRKYKMQDLKDYYKVHSMRIAELNDGYKTVQGAILKYDEVEYQEVDFYGRQQ